MNKNQGILQEALVYFISWDVLGARKEDVPFVEANTTSVNHWLKLQENPEGIGIRECKHSFILSSSFLHEEQTLHEETTTAREQHEPLVKAEAIVDH